MKAKGSTSAYYLYTEEDYKWWGVNAAWEGEMKALKSRVS